MKSLRTFLEGRQHSDSFIDVNVEKGGDLRLKMEDCERRIYWYFGEPGDKRAVAKIKKIKAVIDAVYDHLVVDLE